MEAGREGEVGEVGVKSLLELDRERQNIDAIRLEARQIRYQSCSSINQMGAPEWT